MENRSNPHPYFLPTILAVFGLMLITLIATAAGSKGNFDLVTTITSSSDTVSVGDQITYTISVNNTGPDAASSVVLEDSMSPNEDFIRANSTLGSCVQDERERRVLCTLGSMASGSTAQITVVTTAMEAGVTMNNFATVSSTPKDQNQANNKEKAQVKVNEQEVTRVADLSIIKEGPETATIGSTVAYTLTVANDGPSTTRARITDPGATNLTFARTDASSEFDCSASNSTDGLICDITLNAGQRAKQGIWYDLGTVGSGATIENTATITSLDGFTDPTPANNTYQWRVIAANAADTADLSIIKEGPETATIGSTVAYTLTVANDGPSTTRARITDPGATNLTFARTDASSEFDCSASNSTDGLICDITLNAGQRAKQGIWYDLGTVGSGATIENTATITSLDGFTDPTPANNTYQWRVIAVNSSTSSDLSITKTGPGTTTAGALIEWIIVAANNGSSASPVKVIDDLNDPSLGAVTSATSTKGSCTVSGPTSASMGVECDLGVLSAGETATITIRVPVLATAAVGSIITNTANVLTAAGIDDPNRANNAATTEVTIVAP